MVIEHPAQRIAAVAQQMPPVGDLDGLRRPLAGALGVGAGPIAHDDLDRRMVLEPRGQGLGSCGRAAGRRGARARDHTGSCRSGCPCAKPSHRPRAHAAGAADRDRPRGCGATGSSRRPACRSGWPDALPDCRPAPGRWRDARSAGGRSGGPGTGRCRGRGSPNVRRGQVSLTHRKRRTCTRRRPGVRNTADHPGNASNGPGPAGTRSGNRGRMPLVPDSRAHKVMRGFVWSI